MANNSGQMQQQQQHTCCPLANALYRWTPMGGSGVASCWKCCKSENHKLLIVFKCNLHSAYVR